MLSGRSDLTKYHFLSVPWYDHSETAAGAQALGMTFLAFQMTGGLREMIFIPGGDQKFTVSASDLRRVTYESLPPPGHNLKTVLYKSVASAYLRGGLTNESQISQWLDLKSNAVVAARVKTNIAEMKDGLKGTEKDNSDVVQINCKRIRQRWPC